MVVNNNEQKASEPQEESALSRHPIRFEGDRKEFRLSKSFGKKEPWIIRAWETSFGAVAYFFSELFTAIKTIMREIM